MNAHDVYLDWIHLANKGFKKAEFDLISTSELMRLKSYESHWIQNAKVYTKKGKTHIELI